jgi:hypothetical protein
MKCSVTALPAGVCSFETKVRSSLMNETGSSVSSRTVE